MLTTMQSKPQISEIWQYEGREKYLILLVVDNERVGQENRENYPWLADIIAIDGRNKGTLYTGYAWPSYGEWRKIE